ncbi:hypothetical protein [Rhizobium sp. SGZ-381]|uniref:hypothetical protein n=1 Tax=Rhizobium sp. SGZ-381 TaxID=3342800 RepID=UPI0036702CC6
MTGPFLPARASQPLDLLEEGVAGGGWEALEALWRPHVTTRPLQPDDDLAKWMWGFYNTPPGRAMIEWMMDISIRQPLRITGATIEETALMCATRQGINGFAEAVLAAITQGEKLIREGKTQNGAG